jgi:hypothetical protein
MRGLYVPSQTRSGMTECDQHVPSSIYDGSTCLAIAARDGEPARRRRQTTDHVGEQVLRQACR